MGVCGSEKSLHPCSVTLQPLHGLGAGLSGGSFLVKHLLTTMLLSFPSLKVLAMAPEALSEGEKPLVCKIF